MQGNYVKLLYLQVRDLGKRDGRDSVWALEARKPHTDSQVRTPGLGPVRAGGHHAARGPRAAAHGRPGTGPSRSPPSRPDAALHEQDQAVTLPPSAPIAVRKITATGTERRRLSRSSPPASRAPQDPV